MKFRELATLANKLPELEFDWSGAEQFHEEVFKREIEKHGIEIYVDKLRQRMADYAFALQQFAEAYNQLKTIVLEMAIQEKRTTPPC